MTPRSSALWRLPIERLVPWVALVPVPVWFLFAVLLTPAPAWRAVYRAEAGATEVVEVFEREMSHIWSGKYFAEVPGDLPRDSFVAEFDACLTQAHRATVPFMLVADGEARFLLDGEVVLEVPAGADARSRVTGKPLELTEGRHHLRVEFRARSRPRVGLLASFDGAAPKAITTGSVTSGTKVTRPAAIGDACP